MTITFDMQTTALSKYETTKVFPGRVCRGAYYHFKIVSTDVYVSMQGSHDLLQMVSLGSHRWAASWSTRWRGPVAACTSCEHPSDKTNICVLHIIGTRTYLLRVARCRKLVEWSTVHVLLYNTRLAGVLRNDSLPFCERTPVLA